jgi:hypothetical protein
MKMVWLPSVLLGVAMFVTAVGALIVSRCKHYDLTIRSDLPELSITTLAYSTDGVEARRETADFVIRSMRERSALKEDAARAKSLVLPLLGFGLLSIGCGFIAKQKIRNAK